MSCTQILKRDKKAQEKAPKIIQEEAKQSSPSGTRSFSTSARRSTDVMASSQQFGMETQDDGFGLPALPLPSTANMKYRYDPVVKQVTNLLMRDGKLSVAQRVRPSVLRPFACQLIAAFGIEAIANAPRIEHGNDTHTSPNGVTTCYQPCSTFSSRRSSCISSSA